MRGLVDEHCCGGSMVIYLGEGVSDQSAHSLVAALANQPGVEAAELVAPAEAAHRLERAALLAGLAERIRVVLDKLSTHSASARCQRFAPAEARRIWSRLEFRVTPEHASWLDMAQIKIGVMFAVERAR